MAATSEVRKGVLIGWQGGRGEVARLTLGRGGAGWQRRGRPEDGRHADARGAPRKGVTRSGRGRIVVALRGRCEAAGTGALTELSGSVEKCECRGGSVAPPGRRAEANLPHWLLIGGGRHGQPSHVPRVAELTADPQ